jgi:hypothetical protein
MGHLEDAATQVEYLRTGTGCFYWKSWPPNPKIIFPITFVVNDLDLDRYSASALSPDESYITIIRFGNLGP